MSPRTHRKQHGFTLVESLVVMLTIILLVWIIIPGLLGRGKRAPEIPAPVSTIKERAKKATAKPVPADPAEAEAEVEEGSTATLTVPPAPVE